MIKGFGFGKLLKQLFIISLISCFGLLGNSFVNATSSFEYHNIGVATDINGLNVSVEPYGNLLSDSKKLLNFGNNTFVFWTEDLTGNILLYAYTSDGGLMNGDFQQGFFNTFQLCDEITNLDNDPQNCILRNTYENLEYLHNFMANVNSSDIYGIIKNADWHNVYFAISSNSLGKSLYFTSQFSNNFVNSLNIGNYSFENLPTNLLYNSPAYSGGEGGGNGGGSGGSSDGYIDNYITGDYIYITCTNGYALNKLESYGMNKYMCYGGLTGYDNLDLTTNYNIIAGEGETVFNIYNQTRESGQSFEDWFTYWNTTYTNQYVYNQNLFLNNPAVLRSYFYLYNQYGDGFTNVDIKEYCRLLLTTNSGDIYNGNNQFLCRGYNNGVSQNESGYNVESVNWNGIGNIGSGNSSGDSVKVSNDPVLFIQNFFNELKANLPTRYDLGGGFLPVYIITFLCAIILFRFLSH